MNDFEIKAAKQDLLFNKEDILRFLKSRLEEVTDEKEKIAYEEILKRAEKKEFKEFSENFEKSVIHCYVFFVDDFCFVECDVKDFWFSYDNYSHELYLESFTSENEKEIL